ncbi:hypothetical protein [Vampirovibrio sp.]|uniref:hypothetical protein n=1 Tax=Vampirovibrio sp. TaxID=2717857 RepID=UPI0035945B97
MKNWTQLIHQSSTIMLTGLLLLGSMAWAEKKPMNYPPFKTANGFNRLVQNISGFTPVSGWMANRILKREVGRYVTGNLRTRLTLYSASDLWGGKARQIQMSGQQVLLDDFIPLSEFNIENNKESPIFISKSNRPILLKPMTLTMKARMSEADINRLLTSEKGRKLLTNLKVAIPPFGKHYLDVINPSVLLADNRITIESILNKHDRPIESGLPVKISGQITAKKSRLHLSDLELQIEGFQDTRNIERLVETYFGQIVNLNHIKVDRHKVKVAITQSEIRDRQLYLQADIKVEPKPEALTKYQASHSKKPAS